MNVSTLGTISILALFALCLATMGLAMVGAYRRSDRLIDGAINGIDAVAALAAFSSALIIYAFLADDFSIQYVQHTSDSAMPLFYKITAFWGGLDGSLLFWVLLLSLFSSLAVRANRVQHRALIPHVIWILAAINLFFIGLLVFFKDPFAPFLLEAPGAGRGLNPLLQNIYMVVHPPSLYLGYVSLAVPFAFGVAALITGQVDTAWQQAVRRWSLFSWAFLSLGLVLGGLWAYEELGWGGYWAWDPVENAGLLPWFTVTAFLHSIMIQERRGMLRRWNVSLVIVSFWLSIMGTFMTRSGVVQSVHAFGKDPQLAWAFGGFMVVILVGAFGLLLYRYRDLQARNEFEGVLSREFAFLLNNWLLLVMAFFVLGATMYPTITEWFFDRVTIQPSFFNHVMVPLGLMLLALLGVGPLLAWRRSSTESLRRQFTYPSIVGVAGLVAALVAELTRLSADGRAPEWGGAELRAMLMTAKWGLVCFGLTAFTATTIVQEFYRGVRALRKNRESSVLDALIRLFMRARRRYGGYLIHLGVVMMFFGWAGNSYGIEKKVNLKPGDTVTMRGYELRHAGLRATVDWQKEMITADIEVLRDGEVVDVLEPARWWYYQSPDQPTTEVSRYMTIGEDVYASVQTVDMTTGWTQMRIFINPLVNWIWLGTALMLAGSLICMGTRRQREAQA